MRKLACGQLVPDISAQLSDRLSSGRIDAGLPDCLLQIRVHSVGIDLSGYILVRVEEDRIAWTGFTAELLDEGLPLFEQAPGAPAATLRQNREVPVA